MKVEACFSITASHPAKQLSVCFEDCNNQPLCIPHSYKLKRVHSGYRNILLTKRDRSIYEDRMLNISVLPTCFVSYYSAWDEGMLSRRVSSLPVMNKPLGVVSKKSGKQIKRAVNWLVMISKRKTVYSRADNKRFSFYINFITLTLSDEQRHSDREIKRLLLRPFLKWLTRNGCLAYVWKAEAQSNGRIHFHITTNNFIHWKSIRRKWNELQARHGYHKVFTNGRSEQDANSTDVHSVQDEADLGAYMAKYMSKKGGEDGRRLIEGRLWGCSENLSNVKIRITQHDDRMMDLISEYLGTVDYRYVKDDFFSLFAFRHIRLSNKHPVIDELFKDFYSSRSDVWNAQKGKIEVETLSNPIGLS